MNETRRFTAFHQALLKLCHDPGFIAHGRDAKLADLTQLCSDLLDIHRVSVWRLDQQADAIECEVLYARGTGHDHSRMRLERHLNPAYFDALLEARVIDASDARQDPRTRDFNDGYLSKLGIHSMLDAPVFDVGWLSGVICLEALQHRNWTLPEVSLATAIADTISLINTYEAWCQSQQQLDYITHFDRLTGLPNMASMRERLQRMVCNQEAFALFWLDLDRLKTINHGIGQLEGDQVIIEIANRLRNLSLPGKDRIARTGGDEFILLVRQPTDTNQLQDLATYLLDCVRQPIQLHGQVDIASDPAGLRDQEVSVSASLGICLCPAHGKDPASLLKHAEAAMYHAKECGRGQVQFFNSSLNDDARSSFLLEAQLRSAIRNGELDVHYQPIIRASDGTIHQLEALVRWDHPDHGMLQPAHFLELARSVGLMAELGSAVLHRACQHLRQAEHAGVVLPRVTVNLAPEQLLDPCLPEHFKAIYISHGIAGDNFDFELTEDVITGDSEVLQSVLRRLVSQGARLSIDDFGTGYSSLARLKQLPFDKLKIDCSFIQDIPEDADDCAITLSILGLAHGLDLAVVAEGVETPEHEQWLTDRGCDYLQGYLYSKPVPIQSLLRDLARRAG
ncbi:sensor domain-containing phosphodiesterase [Halomonas sabkhae]|uniref:putative bifunctional diguanylate cyclase/phosphodiesterase n=1 Tax=Halomonas sabkhae TaxID=626223 RepID=UPI0025B49786|nr:sensor domain-containing phosphodiesterase [Halomonas sabkhae]MDN3525913.1 sensor domain-containing phosphodiesterase [Halomonas sabkhae]